MAQRRYIVLYEASKTIGLTTIEASSDEEARRIFKSHHPTTLAILFETSEVDSRNDQSQP